MKNDILFRKATPADASSIASLHAISWKNAYASILPREFLEDNLELGREIHWTEKMNNLSINDFVLLAERDGMLIGFIAVWDVHEKGFPAIVDNLHVRPDEKGKKTGIRLLCMAAAELRRQQKDAFFLWVYDENKSAQACYRKAGGIPLDKNLCEVKGQLVPETRYGWPTLEGLLAIKQELEKPDTPGKS